jgi:hypothetical protein
LDWHVLGGHPRNNLDSNQRRPPVHPAAYPDQRIQQDTRLLGDDSADLGCGIVCSLLQIVAFVGVLWALSAQVTFQLAGYDVAIPDYMAWCALAYALIGSGLSWLVPGKSGKSPVKKLKTQLNQYDGRAPGAGRNFFAASVNWLTFARGFPGQDAVHRAAQADFNVRGWQGRWRYTASAALFFAAPPRSARSLADGCIRRLFAGW